MTRRLEGKTAVVTAAAQGIGEATARAFAAEGAKVWATDVNLEKLNDFEAVGGITTRRCDVTDDASIADLLVKTGAPDILFNCAGYVAVGSILQTSEADWDFSFELNVKSLYRMHKAFLPPMIDNGGGSIVNMASLASHLLGVADRAAYTATKAAVIGLTKSVAKDYLPDNIRANAIAPATVETPSLQERIEATGDAEAARAAFISRQPMGRVGTPEEIAHLAVYLASDESAYTTGQIHVIDGAMSL
ncbi:MAG TPA: NAD(P)-dependent oxidoreductase [Dehalococcoidia bacterium]|nr:NAD(P)-dependent oxidoreductase [Chloroflexota bacterium]HCI85278.1 NAD(P)-dependent oxidoreductase [Dehalococcoidia bacterium]|tara:strand:+ start:181 stop:921 length:741 start_codon:yes stop_codon:yes gene_type:complete